MFFGTAYIFLPLFHGRIGVVDDKRLLGLQRSLYKQVLPISRPQHVEINPHVCLEKPLPVKRRFPRSLNPDKNDAFHAYSSLEK